MNPHVLDIYVAEKSIFSSWPTFAWVTGALSIPLFVFFAWAIAPGETGRPWLWVHIKLLSITAAAAFASIVTLTTFIDSSTEHYRQAAAQAVVQGWPEELAPDRLMAPLDLDDGANALVERGNDPSCVLTRLSGEVSSPHQSFSLRCDDVLIAPVSPRIDMP